MKRFLALFITIFMLVTLFILPVPVNAAGQTVYVKGNDSGEDYGDGTQAKPFNKIFTAISAIAHTGGEIILLGDVDLGYELDKKLDIEKWGSGEGFGAGLLNPSHDEMITIRSEPGKRYSILFTVGYSTGSWIMGGPTTFYDIFFDFEKSTYKRVFTDGWLTIFGGGCTSTQTYIYNSIAHNAYRPWILNEAGELIQDENGIAKRGERSSHTEYNLIFKSGNYNYLFGTESLVEDEELKITINTLITGDTNVVGYIQTIYYSWPFVDTANWIINTTGTIEGIWGGDWAEAREVNIYLLSGTVNNLNLTSPNDAYSGIEIANLYCSGGNILNTLSGGLGVSTTLEYQKSFLYRSASFKPTATPADFTKINDWDGILPAKIKAIADGNYYPEIPLIDESELLSEPAAPNSEGDNGIPTVTNPQTSDSFGFIVLILIFSMIFMVDVIKKKSIY